MIHFLKVRIFVLSFCYGFNSGIWQIQNVDHFLFNFFVTFCGVFHKVVRLGVFLFLHAFQL